MNRDKSKKEKPILKVEKVNCIVFKGKSFPQLDSFQTISKIGYKQGL
jgi:hypothetical protein